MKPRLVACGLALILALSICLPAALAASSDDDSDYHYDDEYDEEYDDNYDDGDQGSLDSDKSMPASTRSPATTTTSTITTTGRTTAAPLWSDEDDVREDYPCPRDCSCEDGTKFLNCSQRSLLEIPTDLPKNVIRLDLSGNNIKRIPVEAFQNCTDVREILLDRNVIEEIDKEVFMNMAHLDVLGLAGNQLSHLATDTFVEAQSLRRLVLSENPLVISDEGPFLEQEDLEELELARCNLTELTRDAFTGMGGLKWLNLAGNEFDEDISTDVFEPLENLQRLNLPPLSEDAVRELCDVVKSIDVVDITTHNISCFYLASETSYEESIITHPPITPEPKREPTEDSDDSIQSKPTKPAKKVIQKENEIDSDQEQSKSTPAPPPKSILPVRKSTSTSDITTTTTNAAPTASGPSSASITHSADDPSSKDDVKKETTPEQDNQSLLASISSDTMKQLLMGIIGVALLVLLIGIICRQTGIKNKLCGSKRRPAPTDQVRPAEEVPLNKV
ncbi:leucine-rich repeat and transmembrane domain-containing protein 2 [Ochlerotatus camptorhynchus]|uniref:leucine-rich repeat and transmembrane domain-containing protein 2 n=1 Tax=Ochlerotatus camptorhynchus TaxID=644619 RepID=UPI0031E3A0B0